IFVQWDVVCDNSWKLPLSQSVLMIGVLFGNIFFGSFSDRYGRKALFTFAPIICLTSSLFTSFAPNLYVFTILTAITAACIVGMSQASFIIGIEFIGDKYRVLCANLQEIIYSSGTILLCIIAYNVRDWRYLQLVLSLPIILTIFYPWYVQLFPESIRWQVSNGKFNKALITLRKAALWNGCQLNEPEFTHQKILNHSIIDSMIFYGLSFQASSMGSNTYLTLGAIAAADIPANIIVTLVMQFFGRKKILFVFSLLAGLSCLSTILIPHSSPLFTIVAIFGKSNISASYTLMYIYSAEIFPTVVRSTGI
ncbi:unnamed protein product, partial [Oppiella nova]